MKIAIIGAGIIGLSLGLTLAKKGFEIWIFEEDREIGEPQHCTGIISKNTLSILENLLKKKNIISNCIDKIQILIGNHNFPVIKSEKKAFILKRKEVEIELSKRFIDEGGKLLLSSHVMDYRAGKILLGNGYHKRILKSFDLVIMAGGSSIAFKRVNHRKDILPAYQLDILIDDIQEYISIYIDKKINPNFFIWETPITKINSNYTVVRIGTASSRNPRQIIHNYIKYRKGIVKYLASYYGNIVLSGPIIPFYERENNIIYIGDAAGQTKITTGGGIAYGLSGVHVLSETIIENDLDNYERKWLNLWYGELLLQKLARKLFIKMDNNEIYNVIKKSYETGLLHNLVKKGSFDMHMTSFRELIGIMPYLSREMFKILFDKIRKH